MFSTRPRAVLLAAALIAVLFSPVSARAQAPEGIKVHGRWTIEVRNADGTLASRREFNNALDTVSPNGGNRALAGMLGRTHTVGPWRVSFDNFGPGGIGGLSGLCSGLPCVITENIPGVTASNIIFPTLTMSVPAAAPGTIVLAGNATVNQAGSIWGVSTSMRVCAAGADPAGCGAGTEPTIGLFVFTRHRLETPVLVTAGQIVQISVVLSFS